MNKEIILLTLKSMLEDITKATILPNSLYGSFLSENLTEEGLVRHSYNGICELAFMIFSKEISTRLPEEYLTLGNLAMLLDYLEQNRPMNAIVGAYWFEIRSKMGEVCRTERIEFLTDLITNLEIDITNTNSNENKT